MPRPRKPVTCGLCTVDAPRLASSRVTNRPLADPPAVHPTLGASVLHDHAQALMNLDRFLRKLAGPRAVPKLSASSAANMNGWQKVES